MQKSWPSWQDHSWSGPCLPHPSHLPPLLHHNQGESVWFPGGCASACASSAPYFSSFAYSCWKKLLKPFWTLSGLWQYPLCTKSTKIHHSKLFRRIKSTLASISSHTLASTNSRLYKKFKKVWKQKYWHKISRSNRLEWVIQRKFHGFSTINFKCKYVLFIIKTPPNTPLNIHLTANVSRQGLHLSKLFSLWNITHIE